MRVSSLIVRKQKASTPPRRRRFAVTESGLLLPRVVFRVNISDAPRSNPHSAERPFPSLVQAAEPGQVVVSDVVRQLVAGKGFKFEAVGPKTLQGLDQPMALYKLDLG